VVSSASSLSKALSLNLGLDTSSHESDFSSYFQALFLGEQLKIAYGPLQTNPFQFSVANYLPLDHK
jgi:hypothetical protein